MPEFKPGQSDVRYESLCVPFSTADARCPRIVSEGSLLRVEFDDWCENPVTVLFRDVVAFSWDAGDAALAAGHRDDSCYTVADSPWLRRHLEVGSVERSEKHRHYKLCFNAAGVLQVLATEIEVLKDRAALG